MRMENLELQLESLKKQKGNEDLIKKYEQKIETYGNNLKKYEEEKEIVSKTATSFESQRDECKLHSDSFGMAVIFLQISILLSSIATLSKKKFVWYCSLILGVIGIIYFINDFFLFI